MTNWLRRIRYLPLLKPYPQAFADELTPSQRNHLRVLLDNPAKLEQLRRTLSLPARRKVAQEPFLIEDRRGAKTVAQWRRTIEEGRNGNGNGDA